MENNIVDIQSNRCIIMLTQTPSQVYTKYLMCQYALKTRSDLKLAHLAPEITRLTERYQQLLILTDTCCINPQTPDLFKSGHVIYTVLDEVKLWPWPETVSIQMLNVNCLVPHQTVLEDRQVLGDRQVLDQEYIRQQYIINVTNQYKFQSFYIKQIYDIYTGQCYLSPQHMDFDVMDDIINNIVELKKRRKSKFKMLVFGHGPDNMMWSKLTDQKIVFATMDLSQVLGCDLHVSNSFSVNEEILSRAEIPSSLRNTVYDLILIQAPDSAQDSDPGRLLPIYWSTHDLSGKGSLDLYF